MLSKPIGRLGRVQLQAYRCFVAEGGALSSAAPDEKAAEAIAVEHFGFDEKQRRRAPRSTFALGAIKMSASAPARHDVGVECDHSLTYKVCWDEFTIFLRL